MTKLHGVKSRKRIQKARDIVPSHIKAYQEIIAKAKDKGELSKAQQRAVLRKVMDLKRKGDLRHSMAGRGRMMKCEENPNLVPVMEYEFGCGDFAERGGGGLEAHPRLTSGILYKAADNKTTMALARETILATGPKDFTISLSSCYNYTENYKKGTFEAKRHHEGKGVNAMISLHRAPKTAVVKDLVVNAHYCSAAINFIVDKAAKFPETTMVDSKDAKALVRCENSLGGKTWKVTEAPDHDWDQSKTNAITPMGHLFLESKYTVHSSLNPLPDDLCIESKASTTTVHVTRTGEAVYLLNLSVYGPETVFRCINEIFKLLIEPSLDDHFRDPGSGKLKSTFIFVVDNGPSECPSSSMVKMLLVRMAKFLKLDRILQISNAEYYSKRNFVEIVHAAVNLHIQRQAVLSSNRIFSDVSPGTDEHHQNMECVAQDLANTIQNAKYGGQYIKCFRGIGDTDNFIFDDEKVLKTFLAFSEQRKLEYLEMYTVKTNNTTKALGMIWGADENLKRSYSNDYATLLNEETDARTSWCGKYITAVFRCDEEWIGDDTTRHVAQPVPDYIKWLESGRMHYMSYESRIALESGIWDEEPDLFLPEKILTMAFKVIPHLTQELSFLLSILAWCPASDVEAYFSKMSKKMQKDLDDEIRKDRWRGHELYAKSKSELITMCLKNGLDSQGSKQQLAEKLSKHLNIESPPERREYEGDLSAVPDSVQNIHRLPVAQIKEILKYHQVSIIGSKDELVLRLLALRVGSRQVIFQREIAGLLDLINIIKDLIFCQKSLSACGVEMSCKVRRYSRLSSPKFSMNRPRDSVAGVSEMSNVCDTCVPEHISFENLQELLEPLEVYLLEINKSRTSGTFSTDLELLRSPGVRVLVYWGKDDLKDTDWKEGMYMYIQQHFTSLLSLLIYPSCTLVFTVYLFWGIIHLFYSIVWVRRFR